MVRALLAESKTFQGRIVDLTDRSRDSSLHFVEIRQSRQSSSLFLGWGGGGRSSMGETILTIQELLGQNDFSWARSFFFISARSSKFELTQNGRTMYLVLYWFCRGWIPVSFVEEDAHVRLDTCWFCWGRCTYEAGYLLVLLREIHIWGWIPVGFVEEDAHVRLDTCWFCWGRCTYEAGYLLVLLREMHIWGWIPVGFVKGDAQCKC